MWYYLQRYNELTYKLANTQIEELNVSILCNRFFLILKQFVSIAVVKCVFKK